ncbi:hypothetical protein Tco_1142645 [Tanacetum coccineum]
MIDYALWEVNREWLKCLTHLKDAKSLLEANEKADYGALKAVVPLEIILVKALQDEVKPKLLRSLSPEWNTHAVVWRNKLDLETMSMDDLYNNLKVYEPEVKGASSSSTNTQNMAFVSSNNSSNTNEAVNTASSRVSAARHSSEDTAYS